MAQPQWITPAGSLGSIPEGQFYSTPVAAEAEGETVYFRLIAGELPAGIQITNNGQIEGVPTTSTKVQGVPIDVARDVTSRFAIRAYTTRTVNGRILVDRINDRTFELTVVDRNDPEFVTPAGNIGTFFDGRAAEIQIEYIGLDENENPNVELLYGQLPPGLIVDRYGLISGVIEPLIGPPGTAPAGWDLTNWDVYPWDFSTRSASRNYQFTLKIGGSLTTVEDPGATRTYEIFVYSSDSLTADTTDFTADNTFITADAIPTRTPIVLTPTGTLGTVRSGGFYAFQFQAIDFDGDAIEFTITTGAAIGFDAGTVTGGPGSFDRDGEGFDRGSQSLPPGLVLNQTTGWLTGYIPDQGATEATYQFAIRVYKAGNPTIVSEYYYYTLTIIGNVNTEVTWLTDPDLGTLLNGSISTLAVAAVNRGGRDLTYRLASGTDSRLPQGLTLQPSGHITGRVSFITFALDQGTTTFDSGDTVFDSEFSFTVNAYAAQSQQVNYEVSAVNIVTGGSGYTTAPTVTLSAPTATDGALQATATATISNGVITSIPIASGGSGYTSEPTVVIIGGGGTGVTVGSVTIVSGAVTAINLISGGSGYSGSPFISITGGGGAGATAGTAVIQNGVVTAITVGNPGNGYLTAPTVSFGGGGGAGVTATASVTSRSVNNAISVFRRFTIRVDRYFNEPYQKLYIKAMPPEDDRALLEQLVQNQEIIPNDLVYRADDPNFGVAADVVYDHAYGLNAVALEEYVDSLDLNHYWKNLTLGEIRTAKALDSAGNYIYDVVYSAIIDDLVNNDGESVGKVVDLPYPINLGDSTEIAQVYPNSLINMRDQVVSVVGQISPPLTPALPLWMTSQQSNGRVLGFTPAWVIAYLQPGQGDRIAYNIRTIFGDHLNKIDFKVDRYELDRSQTYLWDPASEIWLSPDGSAPAATTFDEHSQYQFKDNIFTLNTTGQLVQVNSYVSDGATESWGYQAQSGVAKLVITVDGTTIPYWKSGVTGNSWQLSYAQGIPLTGIQDWNILDSYGTFTTVTTAGLYYRSLRDVPANTAISNGFYWQLIAAPNSVIIRTASGASPGSFTGTALPANAAVVINQIASTYQLDINSSSRTPTVFDGGSTSFISPADQYTGGDEFDKYLLFPKINIIDPTPTIPGPPPPAPNPVVTWRNVRLGSVTWNNNSGNAVVWLNNYA